ncbi:MAG: isochorismate synthase [Myxococcales bacterium]|nr:isochorismate synthase [Myxococcales bacterium]
MRDDAPRTTLPGPYVAEWLAHVPGVGASPGRYRSAVGASAQGSDAIWSPPRALALVEAAGAALEPWFYFHDPIRGTDVVGIGAVAEARPDATLADLPTLPGETDDAPLWLGAQHFESSAGVVAFVPRVVAWRGRRGSGLVVRYPVNTGELDRATERALRLLDMSVGAASVPAGVPVGAPPEPEEPRAHYEARVAAARDAVANGQLRKVVLARAVSVEAPAWHGFALGATLAALAENHPTATVFGVGLRDSHAFVGASPELLVHVDGLDLETHAVAGTAARGHDADADERLGAALLASAKDRLEHALVADGIADALGDDCGDVTVAPPRLVKLRNVQHLLSPLRATLRRPTPASSLAARLHPTPAVGGSPKAAALAWLERTEPRARGLYAGPVGWIDGAGSGTWVVGIRSALVSSAQAVAWAGAGIVAESDPASEWRETELKLQAVLSSLRVEALP